MLTLQNLRWSGKQLLSAILQILQHNLRSGSGWTRAFGPRNSARYFGLDQPQLLNSYTHKYRPSDRYITKNVNKSRLLPSPIVLLHMLCVVFWIHMYALVHWGRVTLKKINWTITASNVGLSSVRRQAIIWTNWAIGNKFQWNLNSVTTVFIQKFIKRCRLQNCDDFVSASIYQKFAAFTSSSLYFVNVQM